MKSVKWILENFGSIFLFQITNHFYGLKPAIAMALFFSVIQIVVLKLKKKSITPFMMFSFFLVVLFGAIDLLSENATFFKFESATINLIIGGYFAVSLFSNKSLVEVFAEQQGRVTTETSPDKTFFFRLITSVWVLYFWIKSAVYFWISNNSSIEISQIFRMFFGTASFYALLGITIGFSQQIWSLLLKLKWMPSTRGELGHPPSPIL
jgi:intracellular septation protein A